MRMEHTTMKKQQVVATNLIIHVKPQRASTQVSMKLSTTKKPGKDGVTAARSTHTAARSTHTPARSTHTAARSTHTPTRSTHTPARSTHTAARSTHTVARSTHTPARSTHTATRQQHTHILPNIATVNSPIPLLKGPAAPLSITCAPILGDAPPASSGLKLKKEHISRKSSKDVWTKHMSNALKDRYNVPRKGYKSPREWMKLMQKHRESERSRHHGLNESIVDLLRLIPGYDPNLKETKVVKLQRIINYICHLEGHIQQTCRDMGLALDFKHLFLSPHVSENVFKEASKLVPESSYQPDSQDSQESSSQESHEDTAPSMPVLDYTDEDTAASMLDRVLEEADQEIYKDELLGKPNILPRSSWDISSEPSQLIRDAAVWSGLVSAEEEECLSHTLADILQSVCDDQDVSKHQQPSHSRHKRATQHDPLPGQIHGLPPEWMKNVSENKPCVEECQHNYVIHDEDLQDNILSSSIPLFGSQSDTLRLEEMLENEVPMPPTEISVDECQQVTPPDSQNSHIDINRKDDCRSSKRKRIRSRHYKYTQDEISPVKNPRRQKKAVTKRIPKKPPRKKAGSKTKQNLKRYAHSPVKLPAETDIYTGTDRQQVLMAGVDMEFETTRAGEGISQRGDDTEADGQHECSSAVALKINHGMTTSNKRFKTIDDSLARSFMSYYVPYEWHSHRNTHDTGSSSCSEVIKDAGTASCSPVCSQMTSSSSSQDDTCQPASSAFVDDGLVTSSSSSDGTAQSEAHTVSVEEGCLLQASATQQPCSDQLASIMPDARTNRSKLRTPISTKQAQLCTRSNLKIVRQQRTTGDYYASRRTGKIDLRKTSWMNGFMMYSRITRRRFIKENPGMHTSQISKLMGQTWRTMVPEEQAIYKEKAKEYTQYLVRSQDNNSEDASQQNTLTHT